MSHPYSAPRRLERSRSDRFIGGVCGGIAKYLNMDPTLVRILTVVITLFTFVPVVAYIIAMFVMPEESPNLDDYPRVDAAGPQTYSPYTHSPNTMNGQADPVWGPGGAPWEQPQTGQSAGSANLSANPAPASGPAAPTGEEGPFGKQPPR